MTKGLFALRRDYWKTEDYWEWILDNLTEEELEKAIIILWSIWQHRNTIIQSSVNPDLFQLTKFIESTFVAEVDADQTHRSR